MILKDKTYNFWKWLDLTVLPALLAFYGVIGNTCHIPYTEIVLTIGAALITCIGSILGISNTNYRKANNVVSDIVSDDLTLDDISEEG